MRYECRYDTINVSFIIIKSNFNRRALNKKDIVAMEQLLLHVPGVADSIDLSVVDYA